MSFLKTQDLAPMNGKRGFLFVFESITLSYLYFSRIDDDCNDFHQKVVKYSDCPKTKVAPSVPFSAATVIVPNCPRLEELK